MRKRIISIVLLIFIIFTMDLSAYNEIVQAATTSVTEIQTISLNISSFSVDKASPQPTGTSVTLNAKATGEGILQYKFVLKDEKGQWYVLRDFTSINTYVWKTGATGNKTLYVTVKDSKGYRNKYFTI